MRKLVFLLLISAVLITLNSSCKKKERDMFAALYGVVSDFATGTTISDASVLLSPSGKTITTGSDGKFEFEKLEPQQYTITIQKTGYQTNRKTVTAVVGERVEVNVTLNKN